MVPRISNGYAYVVGSLQESSKSSIRSKTFSKVFGLRRLSEHLYGLAFRVGASFVNHADAVAFI